MAWRISVEPAARRAIADILGTHRDEFIAQVDAFANDPLPLLRLSWPGEGPAEWVFEYASAEAPGFRRLIFFDQPDLPAQRLVMVAVAWVSDPHDPGE